MPAEPLPAPDGIATCPECGERIHLGYTGDAPPQAVRDVIHNEDGSHEVKRLREESESSAGGARR